MDLNGTDGVSGTDGTQDAAATGSVDLWQIDVTDGDIHAARGAWRAAVRGDATSDRVAELHRGYERLVRTQGRQLGEAVRRRARAA